MTETYTPRKHHFRKKQIPGSPKSVIPPMGIKDYGIEGIRGVDEGFWYVEITPEMSPDKKVLTIYLTGNNIKDYSDRVISRAYHSLSKKNLKETENLEKIVIRYVKPSNRPFDNTKDIQRYLRENIIPKSEYRLPINDDPKSKEIPQGRSIITELGEPLSEKEYNVMTLEKEQRIIKARQSEGYKIRDKALLKPRRDGRRLDKIREELEDKK